jgi:hypothetical protein
MPERPEHGRDNADLTAEIRPNNFSCFPLARTDFDAVHREAERNFLVE